jgi:hypothetical protein
MTKDPNGFSPSAVQMTMRSILDVTPLCDDANMGSQESIWTSGGAS